MFKSKLLKSNLSAFSLKLLLDLVSLFLRSTFLKNLRSAINNVLSFLKSKTCTVTNNLDNLNLVRTYFCKLYVEGILLLSCASTVCTSAPVSIFSRTSCSRSTSAALSHSSTVSVFAVRS